MVKSLRYGKSGDSMTVAVLTGSIVSVMSALAGAALVAKLVDGEWLQEDAIGYAVPLLLILSSYLGCRICAARCGKKWMGCLLTALLYVVLLVSVNALLFDGQYSGVGVTLLTVTGGAGMAMLPEKRNMRNSVHRNLKIPTR